ncbi:MAG TPA: nucleotidyltransferase [Myxococcales bacterium]|nr:nucleotidyltransferase [Myxococcales bacterium]
MQGASEAALQIDPLEQQTHGRALALLQDAGMSPMVGGAYAMRTHAGLWRDTKDLDLFLRKERVPEALQLLADAGYRTELTDPLWIAKAFDDPYFIDLIFSSGNGIAVVDEQWEERAVRADVLGHESLIVPAEEMIWQKAYIQERERFDGADIHHLLRCRGAQLDWEHILRRFAGHWPVLMGHLISFRFAFPRDKEQVPSWVMHELLGRLRREEDEPAPAEWICRGTLLSRQQYLIEVNELGYRDSRELEVVGWKGDMRWPVRPYEREE